MSELRHDPITDRWVVVNAKRAQRPDSFKAAPSARYSDAIESCPFCPGREAMTPPETGRVGPGEPDTAGWRVRSVPNKFPILTGSGTYGPLSDDIWRTSKPSYGSHEVVIMSPDHYDSLADLDDTQAIELFSLLNTRVRAMVEVDGRDYVQIFINHLKPAGASLEHPHVQIIGLDFAPQSPVRQARRDDRAGEVLVREARDNEFGGELMILNDGVVAWCPWASGQPFEVIFTSKKDNSRFEDMNDKEISDAALCFRDVLRAFQHAVGDHAFNLIFRSAPHSQESDFQWHAVLLPRISTVAGFELGSGCQVNIMPPENAAKILRDSLAAIGSPNASAF